MITKIRLKRLLVLLTIIAAIGLLYYIALGVFVRPETDDLWYMTANDNTPYYNFYYNLNGRISAIILYGLFYELPYFLNFVPLISIGLLLAGYFVFFSSILHICSLRLLRGFRVLPLAISAYATLATILLLPSPYASIYWFAAAPVHTWSFSLLLIYVGLLVKQLGRPRDEARLTPSFAITLLVLGVFTGALYEPVGALLLAVSLLVLAFAYQSRFSFHIKIGLLSLVGSLVSVGLLFFSPGAVRRRVAGSSGENSPLNQLTELPSVLYENFTDVVPLYIQSPALLITLFAIGALIGIYALGKNFTTARTAKYCAYITVAALSIHVVNVSLIWIALSEPQPARSFISTAIALVIIAPTLGVAVGYAIRNRASHLPVLLVLALVIIPLLTYRFFVPQLVSFGSSIKNYAQAWDERDALLRSSSYKTSLCATAVNPLPIKGIWTLSSNDDYWVNEAFASYYDLPCSPQATYQHRDLYSPPDQK